MGKHTRPGTPEQECAYGVHYGISEKRELGVIGGTGWFCVLCGGCTGASSTSRITSTGTVLYSVSV